MWVPHFSRVLCARSGDFRLSEVEASLFPTCPQSIDDKEVIACCTTVREVLKKYNRLQK